MMRSLALLALAAGANAQASCMFSAKLNFSDGVQLSSDTSVAATSATLFSVSYSNAYKVATVLRSSSPQSYVLYQRGCPQPSAATLAADHPGFNISAASFFQVPVQRVAAAGTAALSYIEELGVFGALSVVDARYITSPCLQRLAECGSAANVNSSDAQAWAAATANADMVLTDMWGTGASLTARDVSVDDSQDPGLLNRGEWVKFVSLFFNAEAAANSLFTNAQAQLLKAEGSAALLANANSAKPVLAFAQWSEWSSDWQLSSASYKTEAVFAAGGVFSAIPPSVSYTDYAASDPNVRLATVAELHAALMGVDVLVDETIVIDLIRPDAYSYSDFLSYFQFTPADVASGDYPFLTTRSVYRPDKAVSDGSWGYTAVDWLESAVSDAPAVIADFSAILHPSNATSTRWHRNLGTNERCTVLTGAQCANPIVASVCGGPTSYLTAPAFNLSAYSPTALRTALGAVAPLLAAEVLDFPVTAQLVLVGSAQPPTVPDLNAFMAAMSAQLGASVTFPAPTASGKTLSYSLTFSGLGGGAAGAARAAALIVQLSDSTGLALSLASAGVSGLASATAVNPASASFISLTVNQGTGLSATASPSTDALLGAMAQAGLAAPPAAPSASPARPALAAVLAAAAAVALLL